MPELKICVLVHVLDISNWLSEPEAAGLLPLFLSSSFRKQVKETYKGAEQRAI